MNRSVFRLLLALVLIAGLPQTYQGQKNANNAKAKAATMAPLSLKLPLKEGSVRFAVIGDSGTGSSKQRDVAEMMAQYRRLYPFDFVLMMGDNLYGSEEPQDFAKKFSDVYQNLLDDKVQFYAVLGNHDQPIQVNYVNFNMNGKDYYRFKKGNVAFYALNSNYMEKKQLQWLGDELAKDTSEWKIAFFHHPPYGSGKKHASNEQVRETVEPILVRYGVNAVLSGHEHVYERVKPQKGIYYFVSGAGGKLESEGIRTNSPLTEKSFDRDLHFILFEVTKDQLYFQAISRTGQTVDSGVLPKQAKHK